MNAVRFHSDGAAHTFHGFAHNGQSDARSLVFQVRMDLFKNVENFVLILWINPNSIVLDPNPDAAIAIFSPNVDFGPYPWRDELHGVVEQVAEGLA